MKALKYLSILWIIRLAATNKKAVFFDRDGVLNQLVKRNSAFYSPQRIEDFKINKDAILVVKNVQKLGYLAIVISNQPDIARGKMKQSELNKISALLYDELNVDDVLYCTHDDNDNCNCRKPKPGMIFLAQKKYNIDLSKSYMIGDTWKDVDAAKNCGLEMVLLDKEYNSDIEGVQRVKTIKNIIEIRNGQAAINSKV